MKLDDTWGDLLQQYQMMLYESIGYYGNAIKELEDLGGGCGHLVYFKWYCWNIHLPCRPHPQTHTHTHKIAQAYRASDEMFLK
jgi:hypothetical protein